VVIALRNEEAINEQALRRIQRDIDLAEAPSPAIMILNASTSQLLRLHFSVSVFQRVSF